MFYLELKSLEKDFNKKIIDELDSWLAFLPDEHKDKITTSDLSTTFGVDYSIIDVILKELVNKEVLQLNFIILCPNCGREIMISDAQNLLSDVKELDYCIKCDCSIKIGKCDIYNSYKLIKEPSMSESDIRKHAYNQLKIREDSFSKENDLLNYLGEGNDRINDFFYQTSEAYNAQLKDKIEALDKKYSNTTDKGKALEDLAKFLFSKCLGIRATNIIRTKTNQIDCFINNDFLIKNTVYDDMGSIVHVECKNEAKAPGNTYYNKLHGIINSSKDSNKEAVGIIFSRMPVSRDVELNNVYSYFLKDKIIIINFSDNDYKELLNKRNFLDLIKEKIHTLKSRIITDPTEHRLFY